MCSWYIHNIPLTGVAPSTCSLRLDALLENLTVCQLLSFKTPWPAKRFCKEISSKKQLEIAFVFFSHKRPLTFSRLSRRILALTRPATSAISNLSGELDSALVSSSKPTGLGVLNLSTSSSVCVRDPCWPPSQTVICWDPLKANVVDSRPHVGPVYNVAEQSHNGLFHPSVQTPPFWQDCTAPPHWFATTWHEGFTAPKYQEFILIPSLSSMPKKCI